MLFFIYINMKNVIYNFYNIIIDELNKENNNYYFYYKNELYLLYQSDNEEKVIEFIYTYLKKNNIESYEIIKNKDNNLITKENNIKYILLKLKGILKYEYKFEEFKYYELNLEPQKWGELWSNRLDYYNIQIRELGYNYKTILNTFGFFEGLAENAILYYNLTLKKYNEKKSVGIVHNRMNYPCYAIDYNNPSNFIIDYSVRDISEYIKFYIINENYDYNNVILLLEKLNINSLMFNLLYSRILYPTFYFDIFDKIILENGIDKDIIPIINKTNDYLFTLKEIYNHFKDKYNMIEIEWLNKKVEIKSQHL